MVDFRNGRDIEAWLAEGPPGQRNSNSMILGVRSALRVLPNYPGRGNGKKALTDTREEISLRKAQKETREKILLPCFRAVSAQWIAAKRSSMGKEMSVEFLSVVKHAAKSARSADYTSSAEESGFPGSPLSAIQSAIVASDFVRATQRAALSAGSIGGNPYRPSDSLSSQIWNAASGDASMLEATHSPDKLASSPLWPQGEPDWAKANWEKLKAAITRTDDPELVAENWQVWIEWYEAVRDGRNPWPEEAELACALIPDEIWKQGPAVANAEIKRIRDEWAAKQEVPAPEPSGEFEIRDGVLEPKIPRPDAGTFEGGDADRMHQRLKQSVGYLFDECQKVANSRTALFNTVREYKELIDTPLDRLDVQDVWIIGEHLLAYAEALAPVNAQNTMAGVLEPDHYAALKAAAAQHSGFILGFAQGRLLSDRKYSFTLLRESIPLAAERIKDVLSWLQNGRKLVAENARKYFGVINDAIEQLEIHSTQKLYPAYAASKNAMIAVGRTLQEANFAFSSVAGSAVVSAIVPALNPVLTEWISYIYQNKQIVLAYAEMFPEFKFWIGHQMELLQNRTEKDADRKP